MSLHARVGHGAIALGLLAGLSCSPATAPSDDAVEREVTALLQQIRNDDLRAAARQQAQELKTGTAETKRGAVSFFCDLRARSLLLELLLSGEWQTKTAILEECKDVFELDDLPRLYQAAQAALPKTDKPRGPDASTRRLFVERIGRTAAKLLDVEPPELNDYAPRAVHVWWVQALEAAKKKPGPTSIAVSRLIRDLEKQAPK